MLIKYSLKSNKNVNTIQFNKNVNTIQFRFTIKDHPLEQQKVVLRQQQSILKCKINWN